MFPLLFLAWSKLMYPMWENFDALLDFLSVSSRDCLLVCDVQFIVGIINPIDGIKLQYKSAAAASLVHKELLALHFALAIDAKEWIHECYKLILINICICFKIFATNHCKIACLDD